MAEKPDRESAVEPSGADDVVRLWDGRDYDRDWLAVEYPELLAYADGHATFRETCPVPAKSVVKKLVVTLIPVANLLFGTAGLIGGWQQGRWIGALVGLGIANVMILAVVLLFGWATYGGFNSRRPSVAVRAGRAWIYQGDVCSRCWRLDGIEWYVGSLSETTVLEKIALPRSTAIVLAAPYNPNPTSDELFGVGYTESTQVVWRQFLTAAGRLRRTAWEPRPWTMRRMQQFAVGLLFVPGILAAGIVLLLQAASFLQQLGVARDYSLYAAFPIFVPLSLIAVFVHGGRWPWRGLGRIPGRLTKEELRSLRRVNFLKACVPFVGLGLFCLMLGPREIVLADKLPALLFWTPVLVLATWWATCMLVTPWVWQKTLNPPARVPDNQPSQ